jgi:hypothetical protein
MFCRHLKSLWNLESNDILAEKNRFYQSQEIKSQFLLSRDFLSAGNSMKQDGFGDAFTSRRIEELNVLMLEIETVALNVVMCWDVWTAELQRY